MRKYSSVFSKSTYQLHSYFMKGSRRLYRDDYHGYSDYIVYWTKLIETCRQLRLPSEEMEWATPVNPTQIIRNFPFLDGGVVSRGGNYFVGSKGTWVTGQQAFRFVCYELGLRQPRRFKGETEIATHEALLARIKQQVDGTPEQIGALRARFSRV